MSKSRLTAPKLLGPEADASNLHVQPDLKWTRVEGASGYSCLVSKDSDFSSGVIDVGYPREEIQSAWRSTVLRQQDPIIRANWSKWLEPGESFCWKVRAVGPNDGTYGPWSETRQFTTAELFLPVSLIVENQKDQSLTEQYIHLKHIEAEVRRVLGEDILVGLPNAYPAWESAANYLYDLGEATENLNRGLLAANFPKDELVSFELLNRIVELERLSPTIAERLQSALRDGIKQSGAAQRVKRLQSEGMTEQEARATVSEELGVGSSTVGRWVTQHNQRSSHS